VADIQVITIGVQGPAGVSGSSVPATTSTLGGVIVGNNLTVLANGMLSANASVTSNLPWANITGKPTFATVATSGLYSDLTGTPNLGLYLTITAANSTYSVLGHTHAIANVINLQSTLDGKQPSGSYVLTSNSALTDARTPLAHTQAWSTITGTPTLLGVGGYGITDGLTAATAASTYLAQTTAASTYALQATTIATGVGLTGGGSLSASRTLTLATSGATAGTYGSATTVPQVTVDTYGRITGVTNVAITAGGSYTLPIATTSTLGGVRQGSGVVIDPATGIISVSGSGGGTVTSVTGSTGITVTACTTAPVVSIDSAVVATLTGTQTLSSKTLASPTISGELFLNSVSLRQAGVLRQSGSAAMTAYEQLTGSVLDINVATDTTFTLNSGTALPAAWNITIIQTGLGKITIVGAGTYSVVGRNGLKTAGQYAVIGIFQTVPSGVFVVTGDTTT
jgi:hypothetical protein